MRVMGLQHPTCVLNDLGIDVAFGVEMALSAEDTLRSRDLWRAIGQQRLFKFGSGPGAPQPPFKSLPVAMQPNTLPDGLVEALTEQNTLLREQNRVVTAVLGEVLARLDLLLSRPATALVGGLAPAPVLGVEQGLGAVGGDAPMFIPSTFKSEGVSTQDVSVDKNEGGETRDLGDSLSKLRAMRKGGS